MLDVLDSLQVLVKGVHALEKLAHSPLRSLDIG